MLGTQQQKPVCYEEDCEDYEDYCHDGYHPVSIGETFKEGRYRIIQKLGWGHFSTVWMAFDKNEGRNVALKIQKSKPSYCEAAQDEINILRDLKSAKESPKWIERKASYSVLQQLEGITPIDTFCIDMIDHFIHMGPHGRHYCSTFPIMGPNLLDVLNFFLDYHEKKKERRGIPIPLVKEISRKLLIGLDFLHHGASVIHTDLKPENIMLQLPRADMSLFEDQVSNLDVLPLSMKFLSDKSDQLEGYNPQKKLKTSSTDLSVRVFNGDQEYAEQEKLSGAEIEEEEDEPFSAEVEVEEYEQFSVQENEAEDEEYEQNGYQDEFQCEEEEEEEDEYEGRSFHNGNGVDNNYYLDEKVDQNKQQIHERGPNSYTFYWKGNVKINLSSHLRIVIADFGNGCWTHKHFTDNIQTREYRAPETIIGAEYYPNTDIWSAACIIFELLTGDYLFRPPARDTACSKDVNHLILMEGTVGPMPKNFAITGKYYKRLFDHEGKLRTTEDSVKYTISQILNEEYAFTLQDAEEIQEFLMPMLRYSPKDRVSAFEALQSPWLLN